tara:strand:- start:14348 stop:15025 length:678 start_codon:yes stop_codon:yes gene_type:complete
MQGFETWLSTHNKPVTLFVIADSLEDAEFNQWLQALLERFSPRVTIGCHGLNHRSWSAWPADPQLFEESMTQAISELSQFAKANFRPWFRAPAGYMAPWMAQSLVDCGIIVDSSINDTILTKSKSGRGNTWQQVRNACAKVNLVEREWLKKWHLPVNGPALSKFPLSILAKAAWNQLPPVVDVENITHNIEDENTLITTVYWHILDHSRNDGNWLPPIPKNILNH